MLKTKAAARAGHAAVAAAALRWGESVKTARPSVNALLWVMAQLSVRDAPIEFAPAVIRRLACAAGDAERLAEKQPTLAGALGASLRVSVLSARDRRLLDAALVLIADHELNASTFAARIATAAGARWPEAFIAALATATGVRHAAACDGAERMWNTVLRVKSVANWVKDQATREGFDAGAYPDGDPRGDLLIKLSSPRLSKRARASLGELVSAVRDHTGQFPSVDLGLVLVAHVLRLPPGSASVIFAIGRTAGWVAHIEEQAKSGEIIRPRARVEDGLAPLPDPLPASQGEGGSAPLRHDRARRWGDGTVELER